MADVEQNTEVTGNMQHLIAAKAEELFNLCDTEEKGFIIKKDMQRLRDELGVEPEQLEDVFDSLDIDHNGYLTLEEFTSGFGIFLGDQIGGGNEQEMIEHNPNDKEEQQLFHDTLDSLGAKDLYDDEETIMGLWMKLRENDPTLLRQFEQFIGKITQEIRRSKLDHRSIEAALQSKSSVHESEIKKLYDEMEQQIKAEKAKVLAQEKLKERELREQMERELRIKEQQLSEVTKKQSDLEMKFLRLNLNESETKNENERLQKEKSLLEEQLQDITRNLEESKNYISQLQIQTKKEKRDRAKQALSLTENIAIERENLVKQLDSLKSINKRLVDERDLNQDGKQQEHTSSPSRSSRKPMRKQGSILSDYFSSPHRGDSEPEEDDDVMAALNDGESESGIESTRNRKRRSRAQELGAREQPVGANSVFQHSELLNVAPNAVPDRMFKVAFIGDSGVGKTSFIQRFCTDNFKDTFAATIGVDLQVKMLNIDDRIVALQLWDTAGQERFRSITKQYFRKSDGVILVYDVTSEITFRNVRAWMTSVRESAEDDCVVALVGNKTDLCDDDEKRPVKYKDGAKLADDYGCLFFESSARLGTSVIELMEAIARLMQEKDDKQRKGENLIDISLKKKKSGCC
jgi:small GTP-binding protein